MKFFYISLFLLLFSLGPAALGNAATCKEGEPLVKLINHADAVAVVELEGLRFRGRLQRNSRIKLKGAFREVLKSPLGSSPLSSRDNLFLLESPSLHDVVASKQYLMFLKRISDNKWLASRCGYLEVAANGLVQDACDAISDLFSENPYLREKLCLLSYPAQVSLPALRKEIQRFTMKQERIAAGGRFARNAKWVDGSSYQRVAVNLNSESRKKFFGTRKFPPSFPVIMHIASEQLSREKFERYVRKGVRLGFTGHWERGNFVLESLDDLSGRHPRSSGGASGGVKGQRGQNLWF